MTDRTESRVVTRSSQQSRLKTIDLVTKKPVKTARFPGTKLLAQFLFRVISPWLVVSVLCNCCIQLQFYLCLLNFRLCTVIFIHFFNLFICSHFFQQVSFFSSYFYFFQLFVKNVIFDCRIFLTLIVEFFWSTSVYKLNNCLWFISNILGELNHSLALCEENEGS